MEFRSVIVIAALLILAACGSSGYNRSYIISDQVDEEAISQSAERR